MRSDQKILHFLFATLFLSSIAFSNAFAQENDSSEVISYPGDEAIELHFSADTYIPENSTLVIRNRGQEVIDEFTGDCLSDQKLLVFGDTSYLELVSPSNDGTSFYRLTSVRSLSYRDFVISSPLSSQQVEGLRDGSLKDELYQSVKNHVSMGYSEARGKMFGDIDNEAGFVNCVYTDLVLKTKSTPNHTIMNTEHTWPKSKGAGSHPAKSDLHHLFPTDSKANSRRSSYPFGQVIDVKWSQDGSFLGRDGSGRTVFSPPVNHHGDVARSMFYFSIRYRLAIPEFEESVLKSWHQNDPVSQKEIARNEGISKYQKNRNPFVDDPSLVARISDF